MRSTSTTVACALLLGAWGSARAAPPNLPDDAPGVCGDGVWKFEGAPVSSDDDASFNEFWAEDLELVAECMRHPEMGRTCAVVQGHFDDTAFTGPVDEALGSQTAAQTLRADGRALRVLSWLSDAGVPAERLRERPPPKDATWRGASVELLLNCIPLGEPVVVKSQPDMEQLRTVVREALAEDEGGGTRIRVVMPTDEAPGPWWITAGLGFGGLFADGANNVAGGISRFGVGWTGSRSYVHLGGGPTFGDEPGQTAGWETSLGLGWHARRWLDVGARLAHRISGAGFTDPWADQALLAGAESAQCWGIVRGLDLCVEEFIGGGVWAQRAVEVQDSLYFVPSEERAAFVLGVTVAMRQGL